MTMYVRHRLWVSAEVVTAVRERVERQLGVDTWARPEMGKWAIYFEAPADEPLDFLRPEVLPPR